MKTGYGICRFNFMWAVLNSAVLFILLIGSLDKSDEALASERFITLASTTSPDHSGLYDAILPQFTKQTGIAVRVIAVGTGQALDIARRGDADALIVHYRPAEERFIKDGYGLSRHDLMQNHFVLLGPYDDPADVQGAADIFEAFSLIEDRGSTFLTRGDESGTHAKEKDIWESIGKRPDSRHDSWYLESGSGMGPTLLTAQMFGAYTLCDFATWTAYRYKVSLRVVFQGGEMLKNPYSALSLNPAMFPHLKEKEAQVFIDWLLSPKGQSAITGYKINSLQVFYPAQLP